MEDVQLAERELAAQAAAASLCAHIKETVQDEVLILNTVDADCANGTNSMDGNFMAALARREHLTDNFLANAV